MKFFVIIFIILSINSVFGAPCSEKFEDQKGDAQQEQPNLKEGVLAEDTNYGIYGTFKKGTPSETINKAMDRVNAKFGRHPGFENLLW